MKLFSCVYLLILVTSAASIMMKYTDCGSTATIHFILIEECHHDPCVLQSGHNYTILVSFTPRERHNQVRSLMSLTDPLKTDTPVPVWTNYQCGDLSVLCPVQPGILQTYSANFVGPYHSTINVDLKWEIKDEKDHEIICFILAELIQ
ncbi:Phosphatidylglycerol/phosphatidylinositol transfer protein [Mactra antiquata]